MDESMETKVQELEEYWIQKLRNVKRFDFPSQFFYTTKIIPSENIQATVELSENILTKLRTQFPNIDDPADIILSLTLIYLIKLGSVPNNTDDVWFKIFDKKLEEKVSLGNSTLSTSTFYSFPSIADNADCSIIVRETYNYLEAQKSKLTYRRDIFERHSIQTCDAYTDDSNTSATDYMDWIYRIRFPDKEKIIIQNGGKLKFARPGYFDNNIFLEDLQKFITTIATTPGIKLDKIKEPISFEMKNLETLLQNHKPVKNVKFLNNDGKIGVNVELELATPDSVAKSFTRQWQFTFDFMYARVSEESPYHGWTSSFTGAPIPDNEMLAWNNNTVRVILESCNPSVVLEVGCGSGLLLLPIARDPRCKKYAGTDISSKSLEKLQNNLDKSPADYKHVVLKQCEATDLQDDKLGIATPTTYDTIICNSVVQYFKSADYLIEVLESLIPLCKPGGRIFLGDLLSLAHLEQLQIAIQLHKLNERETTSEDFVAAVRDAVFFENELNIHPKFFQLFAQNHSDLISGFDILYHRGIFHNEMMDFRYHVVLHIKGHHEVTKCVPEIVEWKSGQTAQDLREVLKLYDIVLIKNVLNARTHQYSNDNYVQLPSSDCTPYMASLKNHIDKLKNDGIHPEVLAIIAEESGFQDVRVMPSKQDPANQFDIFCSKERSDYLYSNDLVSDMTDIEKLSKYSDYVTDPIVGKTRRMAEKALKQFLLTNKCTLDMSQFHLYDDANSRRKSYSTFK